MGLSDRGLDIFGRLFWFLVFLYCTQQASDVFFMSSFSVWWIFIFLEIWFGDDSFLGYTVLGTALPLVFLCRTWWCRWMQWMMSFERKQGNFASRIFFSFCSRDSRVWKNKWKLRSLLTRRAVSFLVFSILSSAFFSTISSQLSPCWSAFLKKCGEQGRAGVG